MSVIAGLVRYPDVCSSFARISRLERRRNRLANISMGCVSCKCATKSSITTSTSSVGAEIESLHAHPPLIPSHGSVETVRVPSYDYFLSYSYLSQKGYYPDAPEKANQDSFCIETSLNNNPDDHFFAVFDGHGQFGAQCSQFAKKFLIQNLVKDPNFHSDISEAMFAAFRATNAQLHRDTSIDDSMSGTTAITVLVHGKTLYVANVGDSRAVLAQRRGNDLLAMDLSCDQTPFRVDEYERVKQCGARVLSLDQLEGLKDPAIQNWGTEEDADDGGDPPRLWVPNGNYPGTAFTRSIGDDTAETIGVIAIPEINIVELTPDNPFFVVASDGVFEFLSSQAVVDMVAKCKDPHEACAAIASESHRLWLQNETRTDDITIIIVQIHGLKNLSIIQRDSEIKSAEQRVDLKSSSWKGHVWSGRCQGHALGVITSQQNSAQSSKFGEMAFVYG